jgi:methylenetetrahydrofolate reductase (NADPH)
MSVAAPPSAPPRHLDCPKTMTYGPCGGVNPDGTCEIAPTPCVFLGERLPIRWPGADAPAPTVPSGVPSASPAAAPPTAGLAPAEPTTAAGREVAHIMARRPLVIAGFPTRAMVADDVTRAADVLRGTADAVLSGDAPHSRTQYPPSYRALLMVRAGMRVWMGTNTRDRNRAALERELVSMREIGVAGVHCVTGDHTQTGDRPDAAPVFDLESTTLLERARALGFLTSFAESPDAPPLAARGGRVRQKQRAGGQMCLTQYCGDADDVAVFVRRCRQAGADVPVLPGVPVVVDREGAEMLASFHAATLPTGYVDRLLAARDVRREGIRLAIEYGHALLQVEGVGGVVVGGGSRDGDELPYAHALATVAAELGGGS